MAALSWNEIKSRAAAFVHEWKDETQEHAEAKSFWDAFFKVFGVSRRRVASFEEAVKKLGGAQGFIDVFWPGVMIAEHKSAGKDLDSAYSQALDYFSGLDDEELPRYVIVSDFAHFRLYDLDKGINVQFELVNLLDHIELFGFIAGYEKRSYDEQDPVNVKAAAKMGALHDKLRTAGYEGHDLEIFLVRLLFCLFADDTGIFSPRGAFLELLEQRTRADGSDLGSLLGSFFETLNTPTEKRQRHLDEQLAAFPYVNGALFAERLRTAHFDSSMREGLLDACRLDWGAISPAIFGAMFQSAMDEEKRRNLGAHYTSEKNIMKLIGPLFLDDLWSEFERVKTRNSRPALSRFHDKLAALRLFDPACGCGNFLVVAYRELRRLEIEVIQATYRDQIERGQRVLNVADLIRVDVNQCFGIELKEFPAQITQVALWLTDHQMNLEVAETFGEYFTRLPLQRSAHIVNGNALTLDWERCFGEDQPEHFDHILGNPPFIGKQYQSKGQKEDLRAVMQDVKGSGVLDYVTGWYVLAAQYMQAHPTTTTAFVSTNSISQGEQVGVLWRPLFEKYGAKIHFAHRTFKWSNEAPGKAAVHVVVIGWGLFDRSGKKPLFEYEDVRGTAHRQLASNINPYLVDAADTAVVRRRTPICDSPPMAFGNMPNDGGNLLLSPKEKDELLSEEPKAKAYIRRLMGSREFLNSLDRYCLWLKGVSPKSLRAMPAVMKRIDAVREKRLQSSRKATRKLAETPMLFGEIRQPESDYLAVPEVSSENRDYIPIGYMPQKVIVTNKIYTVSNASLYHFGVLSSSMHMAWMRYTAGRMKSDYSYSTGIVYNNFPWPEAPLAKNRRRVKEAGQAVLEAREPHLNDGATLADLYDPLAMPPALVKAHRALDKAVDRAYRPQPFTTETNRVSFLFDRYEALTNALFSS